MRPSADKNEYVNEDRAMLYDMVIKNGTIIDVEMERFVKANIGISDGKIAVITERDINGAEVIDASGLMVSPLAAFIIFFMFRR